MRRHPVDGAAILRASREIPKLAAIVAFEHHLRADGQGYPNGVRRAPINLGTVLCSIADAYDAMRSTRVYQPATPADRIMEILLHNDGSQFDANLVRRFTGLMGVYPPGTLVRLSSGEVGMVVEGGSDRGATEINVVVDRRGESWTRPCAARLTTAIVPTAMQSGSRPPSIPPATASTPRPASDPGVRAGAAASFYFFGAACRRLGGLLRRVGRAPRRAAGVLRRSAPVAGPLRLHRAPVMLRASPQGLPTDSSPVSGEAGGVSSPGADGSASGGRHDHGPCGRPLSIAASSVSSITIWF